MHIVFDRAYGDEVEARRLYQGTFPSHRIPDRKSFLALIDALGKEGHLRSRQQSIPDTRARTQNSG